MRNLILSRESAVWLLLMALTVISWALGANHYLPGGDARFGAVLLLGLAFFKVRLVVRWFMETRHAPAGLKWSCELYVLCSFVLVSAFTTGAIG